MAKFKYESVDRSGKVLTGEIEAGDRQTAARMLQEKGLFPTAVIGEEEKGTPKMNGQPTILPRMVSRAVNLTAALGEKRVSEQDLAVLFRQWSSLISSGLPLLRSLSCLIEQQEKAKMKEVLEDIRDKIQSGGTLADAMSGHRDVFTELEVNMIRAGELGGMLENSLSRLADFTEADQDLKNRVTSAMMYPVILTLVMIVAVGFLLTFVVPRFVTFFRDIQQTLPVPTLILIGLGRFMSRFWWLLVVLPVTAVFGLKSYAETDNGRLKVDQMKLRIPLFGTLLRKVVVSRFARTLSTLVEGGISILSALSIAKDTAGNVVITRALEKVQASVREGENLAEPLRQANEFPPMVIHMIAVGEESGKLGEMLMKVSEVYDREVSVAIKRMTSILEPVIILIMSVVVAFVVLAIVLPILSMDIVAG